MTTEWLSKADTALRGGDARTALRTLLDAWRELRSPALAETIEALSTFVTTQVPPLAGKRPSDRVRAWNERVSPGDPADFGVLAQHLFLANSGRDVGEHITQLSEWPADPRLSSLLHELALKVPFTASSAKPFWRALFTALPKVRDPRTLAALDPIDAKLAEVFAGREDYVSYVANQTKKIRAALAGVTAAPLDEGTVAALDSMRAFVADKSRPTRGAAQLSALFEAVYAEPAADPPREVLADALLDAGDPRGEFLVLQMAAARGETLSREQRRREKELLEEHAEDWLGPLAGWTRKGDRAFRRGFLARCTVEQKGRKAGPFPEIDAWATVEEANAALPLDFAALSRLRGVRRLCGLSQEALIEAARAAPVAPYLEELLVIGGYAQDRLDAIGTAAGLPALRRLRYVFRGMSDAPRPNVEAIVGVFQRLDRLTWLRMELGLAPEAVHAGYLTNGVDVALAREGDESVAHIRVRADGRNMDAHLNVLRGLARGAPFLARTHVIAWETDYYLRGKDPETELPARLPFERVRATGLRNVELSHRMARHEDALRDELAVT